MEAEAIFGAAASVRTCEDLGAATLFEESFHADHPAKETDTPPVEVSNEVGSDIASVTQVPDTVADVGVVDIPGKMGFSVHADASEVAERLSENAALIRSILPLEFESYSVAERSLGTALSTDAFDTGESKLPARSSSVPVGWYVSHGTDEVSPYGANSNTNVCELPVHALVAVGAPIPATEKSAARSVEQFTGSDIVTRSPSILPVAARSMVSTVEICGWRVSTVTVGLTTQTEALPSLSFAEILKFTSASSTGTVQSREPEFAYEEAITCHTPAQVAYSTVIPAAVSTHEMASVIFAGFQRRVFAVAPFQNWFAVGYVQTSEASCGPVESLTKVAPVELSLFSLYALSVQSTFKR